jgi:hypothetical protein
MYNLYWGETHDNTYQAPDPDFSMDRHLAAAASHLDFYSAAYYPYTSPAFKKGGHPSEDKSRQPLNVENWKDPAQIEEEWSQVKRSIRAIHTEGKFAAFPGYEWQGDGTWGDHNVFYNEDDPPLYREDTLEELYARLKGHKAFAIPHHTAYIPGFRGKNWAVQDDGISPFMELYSIHGSSEGEPFGQGLRSNPFLGPDTGDGSLAAAILSGRKVGIVASTDNWGPLPGIYGQGLAGVWARGLTRDDLWEAFAERRVYGVSGDRIRLAFFADGHPMGSVIPRTKTSPVFSVEVEALDAIDYIDFIRDEVPVDRVSVLAGDAGSPPAVDDYMIRIEYGWGPPANVIELENRRWEGAVTSDSASVESASPCFISPGQEYTLADGAFTFSGTTGQDTVLKPVQNGYVLKVRGLADDAVDFRIQGLRHRATLADLRRGGTVLWDRQESAGFISEKFSVDAERLYRKDVLFGMAYKAKIHRAVPSGLFRRTAEFRDLNDDGKAHSYRVRVRQKNGQLAWSSPIWIG